MRRIAIRTALSLSSLVGLFLTAGSETAHAATILVTTTFDNVSIGASCSLRQAITAANTDTAVGGCPQGSGADEIIVPVGSYVLTRGALTITSDLSISGAGASATVVDGGARDRIFVILAPATVTMRDLAAQNGTWGGSEAPAGGGLYNSGTLSLVSSVVSGNTAVESPPLPGVWGGGIYNSGMLSIASSTIRDNSAEGGGSGGGIYNAATLTVLDSDITGNSVQFAGAGVCQGDLCAVVGAGDKGQGGGIYNSGTMTISDSNVSRNSAVRAGGGISDWGRLTLINSEVSANSVVPSGNTCIPIPCEPFSFGGGILGSDNQLTNSTIRSNNAKDGGGGIHGSRNALTNSTVSGNSAATGDAIQSYSGGDTLVNNTVSGNSGAGCSICFGFPSIVKNTIVAANGALNCGGPVNSQGYNISSDASCGLNGPGDMSNTQPLIGPLADNGGPTQTHALLFGSPAIDAGSPDCPPPTADQRGVARPQDGDGDSSQICDIGSYEVGASTMPTPGDVDGDAVPDSVDNCLTVQNTGQEDGDADTVGDVCDNCSSTANGSQANADSDPLGDACDNCPNTENAGQQNKVHAGTSSGDHCEDPEPDGIYDISDNCPDATNPGQENTDATLAAGGARQGLGNPPPLLPADAMGDACDTDDDNDGWSDDAEATIGTNPLDNCVGGPGSGGDAWPPDVTADGFVDTGDIGRITNDFGDAVPAAAPARHDVGPEVPDGFIDTGDIGRLTNLFGQGCT